jgi:hypothetical protein
MCVQLLTAMPDAEPKPKLSYQVNNACATALAG